MELTDFKVGMYVKMTPIWLPTTLCAYLKITELVSIHNKIVFFKGITSKGSLYICPTGKDKCPFNSRGTCELNDPSIGQPLTSYCGYVKDFNLYEFTEVPILVGIKYVGE